MSKIVTMDKPMLRFSIMSLLLVESLAAACASENSSICETQLRAAVVQYEEEARRDKSTSDSMIEAKRNLREVTNRCAIQSRGVEITYDHFVSEPQIYVMLGDLRALEQSANQSLNDLSIEQRTDLLFTAARLSSPEFLTVVVQSGIPSNSLDKVGNNAISAAVGSRGDKLKNIRYLASVGVDPAHKNDDGFSAIDAAVLKGDGEALGLMLQLLNSHDEGSRSSVMHAASIALELSSPLEQVLIDWLESEGG